MMFLVRGAIAFGALTADARSVSSSAQPLPLSPGLSAWAIHALVLGRNAEGIDLIEIDAAPEVFFAELDLQGMNGYPLLERFAIGSGRAELVLADR